MGPTVKLGGKTMTTTIRLTDSTITLDTDRIADAMALPFLRAVDFVLANPESRRLPSGLQFSGCRNGFPSVVAFCNEWQAACETWPVLDEFAAHIAPVFELRERLYPD